MPVTITVRLRHGRYDAAGERPSDAEWPPHPARVFCALAASAGGDADWAVLRWLESQPPPQVWADPPGRVSTGRAGAYVVENATSVKGGSQMWPGRKNGMRVRSFAVPATDRFAIVWPGADAAPEVLSGLAGLARRVPYVGRSTSPADVAVSDAVPAGGQDWAVFESSRLGDPDAQWQLRVPFTGYTGELRAAYRDGRRSWEVARVFPYRMLNGSTVGTGDGAAERTAAVPGPFQDLMVWSFERPLVRVSGGQVVALTSALRRAVLSRTPDPVPAQVSGHGAGGRPHVAFLALPDAGHRHADGHLLGVALAIPYQVPPEDLTTLIRAVIVDPLARLRLSREIVLGLRYGAGRSSLQPARWAASQEGGSRQWVTVTPLMLDGHLRRGRDEATEVARSLTIAGYPEPATVEVSPAPLVTGATWRPRPATLPAGRPHRRLVHARVTFNQPVTGPVLAGSLRYLGLGLFLPVQPRRHTRLAPAVDEEPPSRAGAGVGGRPRAEVAV